MPKTVAKCLPKGQTSDSYYLKLASHHPLFIELKAIADTNGVSWQYAAREALMLYCLLHRTQQPIVNLAKG